MDSVEWRVELGPNFRQEVLIEVMDKLHRMVPSSDDPNVRNDLARLAMKFEQKIYEKATSKSDYLLKIHQRLMRTSNTLHAANPSTSKDSVNVQGMTPNMLFDTQERTKPPHQLTARLQQSSQSQNQQISLTVQRLPGGSPLQPNHHVSTVFLPQQNTLLPESAKSQFSVDSKLQTSGQQQHKQQNVGVQRELQRVPPSQNSVLDTLKQPLGVTNDGLWLKNNQHEFGGFRSNFFNMQHVSNSVEQQMSNPSSQFATLLGPVINQTFPSNEGRLPGLQTSDTIDSQSSVDGSKPFVQGSASDWHDLISQLHSMRNMHLPQLTSLYDKARAMCAEADNRGQQEKYKHAGFVIDKMIKFLHISDTDIMRFPKQKVVHYQKLILQYISSFNGKNAEPSSNAREPHPIPGGTSQRPVDRNMQLQSLRSAKGNEPAGQRILVAPSSSHILWNHASSNPSDKNSGQLQHSPLSSWLPKSHISSNQETKLVQSVSMEHVQKIMQQRNPGLMQRKSGHVIESVLQHANDTTSETVGRHFSGQCSQKPKHSAVSTILHQHDENSAQMSMHSSPQVDHMKQLFPPSEEAGAQSSASPLSVGPASTPSSMQKTYRPIVFSPPVSHAKKNLDSEISAGACKFQHQTNTQDKSPEDVSLGLPASPLLSDVPVCNFSLSIQRLVKAVSSASHEVLVTSIDDMLNAIDSIEEIHDSSSPDDMAICMTSSSLARDFTSNGDTSTKKMKRRLDITAVETSSIDEDENSPRSNLSTTAYRTKRPRCERNHQLLNEIRKINNRMVETIIELVSNPVSESTVACERTVVRCTYSLVAGPLATMLPAVAIKLLLPSNYPASSAQILDELPTLGNEDLTEKVKSRFKISLRSLQEPITLTEMARAWDDTAREFFLEFAHGTLGGGSCLRSEISNWKSIAAA